MNASQARKLRRLLDLDINEERDQYAEEIGSKTIGILSHDGNHGSREDYTVKINRQ